MIKQSFYQMLPKLAACSNSNWFTGHIGLVNNVQTQILFFKVCVPALKWHFTWFAKLKTFVKSLFWENGDSPCQILMSYDQFWQVLCERPLLMFDPINFLNLLLILISWLRAALGPLAGHMQPTGLVFEVPALKWHFMWFAKLKTFGKILFWKNGDSHCQILMSYERVWQVLSEWPLLTFEAIANVWHH